MTTSALVWKELNLGSNIVTDTPGVIVFESDPGKRVPLVALERGQHDYQLLLTIDVYDADGGHIAKLRRNAWAFNEKETYSITTNPRSLRLTERDTGRTVVEANVLDRDRIAVLDANIYTPDHRLIEVTPNHVQVGGSILAGNLVSGFGAAIVLTPFGFMLGAT